jgi:two-component system response regulator QseB
MAPTALTFGEFQADRGSRVVTCPGRTITLSPREFGLLEALLERPGIPLSRLQLRERLYGEGREILGNPVQVHVHNVRAKLGVDVIRTIRGMGYVINRSARPPGH